MILAMVTNLTVMLAEGEKPPWFQFIEKNGPIMLMVVAGVMLYMMMIRSKQKQERSRRDMLGQLKRGDSIQTIGGIMGKVVDVTETTVVVKVDETSNTKMKFVRSAIHRVIDDEKENAK